MDLVKENAEIFRIKISLLAFCFAPQSGKIASFLRWRENTVFNSSSFTLSRIPADESRRSSETTASGMEKKVVSVSNRKSSAIGSGSSSMVSAATAIKASEKTRGHRGDLVIFNPFMAGSGDRVLAKKVAMIAREEGYRVCIAAIERGNEEKVKYTAGYDALEGLRNPVFIVSPVSAVTAYDLQRLVKFVCKKHHFGKESIALIEEMSLPEVMKYQFGSREIILKEEGFSDIQSYHSGFQKGEIGYVPITPPQLACIKENSSSEIHKLFDSYNMDLRKTDGLYVAYITSPAVTSSATFFVRSTLAESQKESSDACYVLVVCDTTQDEKSCNDIRKKACEDIASFLNDGHEKKEVKNASLFKKANMLFFDTEAKKLEAIASAEGKGSRNVNVIVTSSLPQNIFLDLVHLAKSGMASGDHSLSEYISLKGEVPYYDQQYWKEPLIDGLKDMGKLHGVEKEIKRRVTGLDAQEKEIIHDMEKDIHFDRDPEFQARWEAFNADVSSRRADVDIRNWLRKRGQGLGK